MIKPQPQSGARADLALVIHDLGAGGSQRVLATLANAWHCQGRRVCVITFTDERADFFQLEPGISRIVIGLPLRARTRLRGSVLSLTRILALRRAILSSGASVVIAFLPVTSILSILAAVRLKKCIIVAERNDPSRQLLPWPWELLRRRLYRYADLVIANSRGAVQALGAFVPQDRLRHVPNPLVVPPGESRHDYSSNAILSVGRLTHQKAYDVLLAAFAKISAGHADWQLSIIGDGPLKHQLQQQAARLGIGERVQWHGRVGDPFSYYRGAEIFVLPSRFEGMPNALLEAMGCGLPVVVSKASSGFLDYVEDDVSGLVVPVEDVDGLASAMERLIGDNGLRRRLGEAARSCVAGCQLAGILQKWNQALGW